MPKISKFNITKTTVDALIADRDAVFYDAKLTGFGVRTKPSGKKFYVVHYQAKSGKFQKMTLGAHGVLLTDKARDQARVILGRVADGMDPAAELQEEAQADTVARLCDVYVAAVKLGIEKPSKAVVRGKGGKPKKASTLAEDMSRIKRHIIPLLGDRKLAELKQRDIKKFFNDVTTGKSALKEKTKPRGVARVTGGSGVAARAVGLLGGMMTFAISEGLIDSNPCHGIQKPAGNRRKVRLSPEQYSAIGAALRRAEEAGVPWQAVEIVRTLILTGCRKSEVVKLQPCEADLSGNALRLIDSKTGESIRPLGNAAVALLKRRIGNEPFVFYSDRVRGAPYAGINNAWPRIRAMVDPAAKLPHLTLHGLRHAFASTAGDMGYSRPRIKELLGHAQSNDVTDGYIHALDSDLIAAANRVSAAIAGYLDRGVPSATSLVPATASFAAVHGRLLTYSAATGLVSFSHPGFGVKFPAVALQIGKGGNLQ